MLFHVGALRRLNELGYLPVIERFSSVSGGSIAAGVLAASWAGLDFDDQGVAGRFGEFEQQVFDFAGVAVDRGAVLGGVATPFRTVSDNITRKYRQHLFGDRTLQDLPDEPPRFNINATNLQTGALLRMSKQYAADYRIGIYEAPTIELAGAVAASSAFPPVLSPKILEVDRDAFRATGAAGEDLHRPPFTTRLVLSDGGVYDNLGLQSAANFHTVLVSDGGAPYKAKKRIRPDWMSQASRAWLTTDRQVRALRKSQLMAEFNHGERNGAYWGIGTDINDYGVPHLPCALSHVEALAKVGTRLKPFRPKLRYRLINWGYAVCDTALRAFLDSSIPVPGDFPYPDFGIG
jgi:NTE family protein